MKKLALSIGVIAVAALIYHGAQRLLPRYVNAVVAGKSPRTAVATVIRKGANPDGTYFLLYRIDEFRNVDADASKAIMKTELRRYAGEGPRRKEVRREEFATTESGQRTTVLYAYYPSILWGISDKIRIPW